MIASNRDTSLSRRDFLRFITAFGGATTFSPILGACLKVAVGLNIETSPKNNRKVPSPTKTTDPEMTENIGRIEHFSYYLPEVNTEEFNRLGLIITRLDVDESVDSVGGYTIDLKTVNSC